jgi:hypothetical protein
MIDPILRKMILNWVYEEVISYTHNEEKAEKSCVMIARRLDDFRESDKLEVYVNATLHNVYSVLDEYWGIDVDYDGQDIDEEGDRILMKWKAIKQGVDNDLVDILDI